MLLRSGCLIAIFCIAICCGFAPRVEAAEHSGLLRGASCSVVRFYVAKFSASAAEIWARSHGATEAEILQDFPYLEAEDIRACLEYASDQIDHAVVMVG